MASERKFRTSPYLNEYDREEWFDVCRKLKPGITTDEFHEMWDKFVDAKEAAIRARALQ